jgi:subtilisin family serine protease
MVDSGWFRHPFFTARGYRSDNAILGPSATNPAADESGHGTGESANIFANAPDVRLRPIKMNFVNSIGAFNTAVGLGPDIITCSWGSSQRNGPLSAANIALANAVASAVASGIVVVFSAGNGHWGFPGQHPDVISAGGVHLDENNDLQASNYSSGFASSIYPGRRVPDLSGVVGMMPKAMNIMLPVEPRDSIDTNQAGGTHPNGDETATNDGWACFSGTSAAAPQLAGVAALLKQACSRLSPAGIRQIMMDTAKDVTTGRCHPNQNNPATVGPDLATGHGLVDAHRATLLARLRCRPIGPVIQPIGPVGPVAPVQPIQPIRPIGPIRPIQPVGPIRPIQPVQPIRPIRPIGPVIATENQAETQQYAEQGAGMALTEEELDAIEDLMVSGKADPDTL